jgi:hypothetical protein
MILIACEESQAVTIELRKLWLEAFSCDILPTSGLHPEWHIQGNVLEILHDPKWKAVIAFPPCTHLSVSGAHLFKQKIADGRQPAAVDFFMQFANLKVPFCIENPIGIMSTRWRKPDQVVQPWMFGHSESKATCLWLNGLPVLTPTIIADFSKYRCKCGSVFSESLGKYGCCPDIEAKPLWDNMTPSGQNKLGPSANRASLRSKTYPGIAQAMATQWYETLKAIQ